MYVSATGGGSTATTLNAGDKTWTLANPDNANPFDIDQDGGVLVGATSTFVYSGDNDAGNVTVENAAYNNLTFGGAAAENYDFEDTTILSGDLAMNTNATLIGTDNIYVNGGDVTGDGTITMTGGKFTVGGTGNFGGSAAWTFNNLVFSQVTYGDNFNRADANPIGGNWTTMPVYSALKVASNKVQGSTASTNGAFWNASTPSVDQFSELKMDQQDGGPAVRVRTSTQVDMYFTDSLASIYRLARMVNGSYTILQNLGNPTGKVVRLEATGSGASVTLKVFYDGVQQGSDYVDTNAARLTTGTVGIYLYATDSGDDWQGGEITTATTTTTGSGGVTVSGVMTASSGQTLDAKGKTWTLSGTTGTPLVITGTLNDSTDTSTFLFTGVNGSGDTTIPASTAYNNITLTPGATENYTIGSGTVTLS